ncbi:urease accessory protein UreD [Dermacoccus nishinomiyaensis]|uniref:urease accessory protein UreD n=1 Tax=Dermacoccus nishinomiyaensis TaxID=1274 RepID=UPI001F50F335|nr:urease accessory protein UreD [Dermacoccus nishinomiyaensis]
MTPTSARVALVATTALLLAGDEAELDIVVGDGVALEIVEVAATVAYAGRGGACSWSANLNVAEGASIRWPGEPFVVATDARATRTTRADIADGGSLMLRDTLVLGRHGEAGGELVARTDISHAGRPALVEEFRLAADDDAPGIRGGRRVVDQVTMLGSAPAGHDLPVGVTRLDLFAPGRIERWLGDDVHLSPLRR